jgi:hypothetical protein
MSKKNKEQENPEIVTLALDPRKEVDLSTVRPRDLLVEEQYYARRMGFRSVRHFQRLALQALVEMAKQAQGA